MSLLYQISYKEKNVVPLLGMKIWDRIQKQPAFSNMIIFCIGTDRCTGDALGPLVGMFLEKAHFPHVEVWGTLEQPIHALNLREAIRNLSHQEDPFIISIDACLGYPQHVGDIQVVEGPLRPGMGVKKVLPSVGDFHIKGIVNASGFLDTMVLQNTRLSTVMQMAEVIADSLLFALRKLDHKKH